MKSKDIEKKPIDYIKKINVNTANFRHIADTGNINGTLLTELIKLISEVRKDALSTKQPEEMDCFLSVSKCYKCDPVWASQTLAPTYEGKIKCECGHAYNQGVEQPEKEEEKFASLVDIKCSCHGSGVNSFSGRCDRCGRPKQ